MMSAHASDLAFRAPCLSADACLAALLLAVDPVGLGGITLTSGVGAQRDTWLAFLEARLPAALPRRRLPISIADDRLLGGLDLAVTLSAGRPVVQRGLLAEVNGGVLIVPMAERMEPALAARLAATLDQGEVVMERDGLSARHPARFGVILLDERREDEEPPPAGLRDRLAFAISLDPSERGDPALFVGLDSDAITAAQACLGDVTISDTLMESIGGAALAFGVDSARIGFLALRAARAAAALDGRVSVSRDDVILAARLVIAPRATQIPASSPAEEEEEKQEPEKPPQEEPESSQEDRDDPLDPAALQDLIIEATKASLPANLLARLASGIAASGLSGQGGRAGQSQAGDRRGRPIGVRRGLPKPGQRLNVLETLRAAAPWQVLRRAQRRPLDGGAMPPRIEVRRDDFRITRFKQHAETVTIFVVDASGSAAVNRLAEAKGAVELLLADCYIRRDSVALIAFSGTSTEVLLPPTRSLVMAKRRLTGLPGGGGTPLAAAMDAALMLADAVRRKGQTPVLVFMTDGKANIARDGTADRVRASADAIAAARALAVTGIATLMIDIGARPRPPARDLADAMRATYLPLPSANPERLSNAVKEAPGYVRA